MLAMLITILELGSINSLVSSSVWLTSTLLKFDDLAVEASFCLGGALCARLLTEGCNPLLSTAVAVLIGCLVGLVISILAQNIGMSNLLAGITTSAGLFSVNLFLGTSNLSVAHCTTLFTITPHPLIVLLICSIGCIAMLSWLLRTRIGLLLRAVGENPFLLTSLGKSVWTYTTLHLLIAHGLCCLAGALFIQYTGFFSIWTSIGILITSIAGSIISKMFSSHFGFNILVGSVLYQAILAASLSLPIAPEWNKLISGLLLIGLIIIERNCRVAAE
ncbi:hypothetical protein FJ365_00585 [Candidatus Dependentiae bacterium]|nr:hypothetical protein [Candidatus Dependentiae bacterium]